MRLPTPRQLDQRSRVAVLVVILLAMAMLGVLLVLTPRHGNDIPLANAAGRERYFSGLVVTEALAVRSAPGAQRAAKRQQLDTTIVDWLGAAARLREGTQSDVLFADDEQTLPGFAGLVKLQREVIVAARTAAADSATAADQRRLDLAQRRYLLAIDGIVGTMETDAARRLDVLVLTETVCVLLLLTALGLGVRLALQPTQERLLATVEQLAESESRTRAVLDAMQEGMILVARSGRIQGWNPSALQILGVKEGDEGHLQSVARRMINESGEPREEAQLPSRITLETGRSLTNEVVGIRRDEGEIRWLSVNTHPLRREPGEKPYAVVSIFRDITRDRRAEEERAAQAQALEMQNRELISQADALERGQALYRSVVETAGTAIVGLDRGGRVIEWNREAEALYGVPRDEAIGQVYLEAFLTERHRDEMRRGITEILAGRPLRNFVGTVKSRSGSRSTVLWNITPLRDGEGMPVHGLIAAGSDITEREASDERFRVLFERSSDAHLLYDEKGVIDCNDATLRMLRYASKEAIIGRTPTDLSPRRQPDGRLSIVVGEQMRRRARVQGFHRFEWEHQRADGTGFPVEITLTPVRLHGREVILAVWHDIAERKAVEDALRSAKDAAESANRTKSEFMTRMNHELRTPLTAIIGFSRVLLQGKEGPLSDGAQQYAERIRANGMHLLSLINQILDVAKVEAGRMELELETVSLDALVKETLAMLEGTADAKGIVLRRELPAELKPLVTDAGKLRQILINLVGNAIKFTSKGEVCVRVTADPVSGRPLSIAVSDTGIGIAPERQRKVFEPFEQGDSSTRREFGGTGLGLSIVRTFSGLIGARIALESEVGTGTTVTLWLPIAPTLPAAVPTPARAARAV
ncbi:MAG TPA: PAS domain S-box protein [Gemmatimonadaceae bacterium]|nr:PAS domain S-box protein [Gemmatimonadaceae bacterium]